MELKPQDLVVALKALSLGKSKWNQRSLAESLGMSLSEVNGALKRAVRAGLMIAAESRERGPRPIPYALQEFIQHGVRYAFPLERVSVARGIPTGLIGSQLDKEFSKMDENEVPVWPWSQGKVRGIGVKPLYRSIPDVIEREENRELYTLLALVDVIREGRPRERKAAVDVLGKKMKEAEFNV